MKIAMLGGSFNPPHIAHLILADSVCTELGYDRVLFVPVCKPSHIPTALHRSKTLSGAFLSVARHLPPPFLIIHLHGGKIELLPVEILQQTLRIGRFTAAASPDHQRKHLPSPI